MYKYIHNRLYSLSSPFWNPIQTKIFVVFLGCFCPFFFSHLGLFFLKACVNIYDVFYTNLFETLYGMTLTQKRKLRWIKKSCCVGRSILLSSNKEWNIAETRYHRRQNIHQTSEFVEIIWNFSVELLFS